MYESVVYEHMPKTATARNKARQSYQWCLDIDPVASPLPAVKV